MKRLLWTLLFLGVCGSAWAQDGYVPKEKEKDVQLKAAIDLLHGKKIEQPKKLENASAPIKPSELPN